MLVNANNYREQSQLIVFWRTAYRHAGLYILLYKYLLNYEIRFYCQTVTHGILLYIVLANVFFYYSFSPITNLSLSNFKMI